MGFWETVLQRVPYPVSVFTPNVTELTDREDIEAYCRGASPGVSFGAGFGGTDLLDFSTLTPARLWRSQPHLRTVVSFLARNIAQLGVHSFERVSETDRRRDRTSPAARALADPDVTYYPKRRGIDTEALCLIDDHLRDHRHHFLERPRYLRLPTRRIHQRN